MLFRSNPPQYSGYEYAFRMNENWNGDNRWQTNNPTRYHINYVYNRSQYEIEYFDGTYFDGNGQPIQNRATHPLHTSDPISHGATIPEGCRTYEPTLPAGESGYVFEGWYLDEGCTTPYEWSTMPIGGIKVYAKWRKVQYRVFLNPNVPAGEALDWGSDSVSTSFRVDYGEKISTPNGKREGSGYEFVGWYTDQSLSGQYLYNSDTVLNDSTVTTPYNLTDIATLDFTERDKYGNPLMNDEGQYYEIDRETGEQMVLSPTWNKDYNANRVWIKKKLELYAKWRKIIEGADGIQVVYVADEDETHTGTNPPVDPTLYPDQAEATAQAASTPTDSSLHFKYWVVQKWDGEKYVDTETTVKPGQDFTVMVDYAKKEARPDEPDKYDYTMQLRAEYQEPESELPTHVWWFENYDGDNQGRHDSYRQDEGISINEAVNIPAAPAREGYLFLGWARVPAVDSESAAGTPPTGKVLPNLGESDLYLKYENGQYKFGDKVVTHVAADEADPYHDMYAVWKPETYTVTIKKIVVGLDGDKLPTRTFSINYEYSTISNSVSLAHGGFGEINEVPFKSIFKVEEPDEQLFDKRYEAVQTTDKQHRPLENPAQLNLKDGGYEIKGDTTITVTNTRNTYQAAFKKTDLADKQLSGAVFELLHKEGENYVRYTSATGAGFSDGFLTIGSTTLNGLAAGEYMLEEKDAPAGYIFHSGSTYFTIRENGTIVVTQSPGRVGDIELAATNPETGSPDNPLLTIRNEPGQALPNTGGPGTLYCTLGGLALVVMGAVLIVANSRSRERHDARG